MTDDILETERDLLGAALLDPRLTEAIRLHPDDYADGRHGAIWAALTKLHQQDTAPDPVTVVAAAKDSGATVDHAMIVDLIGRGVAANADTYAQLIQEAARSRRLTDAMRRGQQMLDQGHSTDQVAAALAQAIDPPQDETRNIEDAMTLDEFIDQPIPPDEWVIPDLLTKGDRTIITGAEGFGKTQLIRQIAICAAAGIDPFTFAKFDPVRVLYVDAENPKKIMQRRMGEIREFTRYRDLATDDRLWIKRYPQGLDLGQVSDRLLLRSLCKVFRPDLLVIGPAYKLYVGGGQEKDELLARQVTSTIDGLREEFGFAVILEHHSPHGGHTGARTVRPFGSSLWLRWPEFGFGLAPSDKKPSMHDPKGKRFADVEHWRGARDERPWPTSLESHGVLPWIDTDPTYAQIGA